LPHSHFDLDSEKVFTMSSAAERQLITHSELDQLREAKAIIRHEAQALHELSERLDTSFTSAIGMLHNCQGRVVVCGIGKAGLIGQKIAATLSSTGTRAQFLHPAEAVHGDLGALHADDVFMALSNSGETEEVCRLLPVIRKLGIPIVAVTSTETSTLGSQADVTVCIGRLREAGLHGLAPTTSTTAMLALGDALALVLNSIKGFTPGDFALFHPGGNLGRRLSTVGEIMRKGDGVRIAPESASIREVFVQLSRPGRRTGAVMLVDAEGRLSGLFTDSDLARLLEQRRDDQLDRSIGDVMTRNPVTIRPDALFGEAVDILSQKKVSELPVVDDLGRPVGLVDITDVIGQWPPKTCS
jgi:arabinose-5-phosphate isomerase